MLEDFDLSGRRAVVTGGGKGFGRGIALARAGAGADVMVAARTQEDVDEVAAAVAALGRQGFARSCDVTAEGEVDALADAAVEAMGGVDIWVNNAGGLPDATPRYLTRTPPDRWAAQLDLNLTAVWQGCVSAARVMGDDRGAIVNISSSAGDGRGNVKNGPYGAAKSAVNSLTATFSIELAPAIRVNAVAPGPVPTENFMDSVQFTEERRPMIEKQLNIPLRRLGTERDIGNAVVFLASDAASWITGQVLRVTGGR